MAKDIVGTITERGQVTVTAEVRRVLGVGPRGKVVFTIEDDQVRLTPATFTLESAYGSVNPPHESMNIDDQIRLAKEQRAARAVRREKDR